MQLGLVSGRAVSQAVSHFQLIRDAHARFQDNTHGTSFVKTALEKESLEEIQYLPVTIISQILSFRPFICHSEN
jgi:hypothetical protein